MQTVIHRIGLWRVLAICLTVTMSACATREASKGVPTFTPGPPPTPVPPTAPPAPPAPTATAKIAVTVLVATPTPMPNAPQPATPAPSEPPAQVPVPTAPYIWATPPKSENPNPLPFPNQGGCGSACSPPGGSKCATYYYIVRPGDNLFRIGLRYGVTAYTIARQNGIPNIQLINPGQRLRIVACR